MRVLLQLRSEVLDMDYERFGGMPKPLSVDNFRQRQTLSPADLQSVALNKPSSAGYALSEYHRACLVVVLFM